MKAWVVGIINAAVTVALLTTTAHADCASQLQSIFDRALRSGPFHAELTTVAASTGCESKLAEDVIPPDDFYNTSTHCGVISSQQKHVKGRFWLNQGVGWQETTFFEKQGWSAANYHPFNIHYGTPDNALGKIIELTCDIEEGQNNKMYYVFHYRKAPPDLAHRELEASGGYAVLDGHEIRGTLYVDYDLMLPAFLVFSSSAQQTQRPSRITYTFDRSIKITPP